MKLNIKTILVSIAFVITSVTALAGSHVNLSSDPSDYSDQARFMRMCTEFNAELPNVEAVCQNVAIGYFPSR